MHNQDRLINFLSNRWQKHQPKMYRQFIEEHRLPEELEKAAESYAERLHELVVVKKIPYLMAEEMVNAEVLQGEPEEGEQEQSM